MAAPVGPEAVIPNPALAPLAGLVGNWRVKGWHPHIPGTELHGRLSFAWIEGGAFLIYRSEMEDSRFPSGVAIIGSDDATGEFSLLYFDQREISRKYEITFKDNVLTWERIYPEFSQRFTYTLSQDGQTLIGKGRMSRDEGAWEDDLQVTCTRVE
jgi:hypothetical protein